MSAKLHIELDSMQRKSLLDKYLILENCTCFYRPVVNHETWTSLSAFSTASDKSFTALQVALLIASIAVAMSIEENLKHPEKKLDVDYEAFVSRHSDISTFLWFICKEFSYRRKEAMGPSVHPEFRGACGRNNMPAAILFGGDLTKTIQ